MSTNGNSPPGPSYYTPLGVVSQLRNDPLSFCQNLYREFGDVVRLRMGPWQSYMLFHPDHIKHVLQDNNQNYVKGVIIGKTKVLIGEGLFTSEGSFWRRQRRLVQPAFHREHIAGFVTGMADCTATMLDHWEDHARTGGVFDGAAEMNRLTLRIAGKALFSMDLDGEAAAVGGALMTALEYVNRRAMSFIAFPVALPTLRNLRFVRARRVLDDVVYDIIRTRRRTGQAADDLLSILLATRDEETGECMTDRQLRDEVMTFVLAGHETTAMTLTWAWYLLAKHPAVEERLRAEVRAALGDRPPTAEDLPALRYTRMVIDETMRLYPPLWALGRQTINEDRVGGYVLGANVPLSICSYVTHRLPAYWPDPERFDPERFTAERVAERARYAYLPFSGGPRQCIGNEFAIMEALLVIAMVMQRYRVVLPHGHTADTEVRLTLRPRGGLPVTLERV